MAAKRAVQPQSVETRIGTSVPAWMFFIGTLLLLMGLYGALRIAHIMQRGVPYPATGVLPANFLFDRGPFYYARETDCKSYALTYYEVDGKTPRPATEDEKSATVQNEQRCSQGFEEDRQKQRQYDRNLSAFLIFTGAGLLLSSRFGRRFFPL